MDKNEQMQQMDDAAVAAKKELVEHLNEWSAKDLILWWAKSYMKAGHKRLGRILVEISRKFDA